MADDESEERKPIVGLIPQATRLPVALTGQNTFKVDLLVYNHPKKEPDTMHPFKQVVNSNDKMSIGYYVATPGLAFSLRVTVKKPSETETTLYGARVYIDNGKATDKTLVYTHWYDEADNGPNASLVDKNASTTDTSKADHFFWFEPGQTEHIITGFYKTAKTSQRFVFAKPSKKRVCNEGQSKIRDALLSMGTIRVVICSVKDFRTLSDGQLADANGKTYNPEAARIPHGIDKKVQLVAKPGPVIRDADGASKRHAVLNNTIVYERRIVYNALEGFSERRIMPSETIDFFKGMPLEVLLPPEDPQKRLCMRTLAITTFYRSLSAFRMDLSKENNNNVGMTNQAIRVEDLVHFICDSLSPAASYIVCTGRFKAASPKCPRNYGERVVQQFSANKSERLRNYEDKERGLVEFFQNNPEIFDLRFVSRDESKRPPDSYEVKLAVVSVDSDDDED